MEKFLAWCEKHSFVSLRALTLYSTLWFTWVAFDWAGHYAFAIIGKPGIDVAAVIAAVTVPISALQAFTFKWYMGNKVS
jgi:hypothetical protein